MQANCSISFSPGKSGYPVYNSAKMQPAAHRMTSKLTCGRKRIFVWDSFCFSFGRKLTQTPHVDRRAVGQAEDDLRRAVEARLDVGEHPVVGVARTAKVDHFDARTAALLQQHVFLLDKNNTGFNKNFIRRTEKFQI